MLHELLLALSGCSSPLLDDKKAHAFVSLLSPSEKALLRSLAHLGSLQSEIRTRCTSVSTSHASTICRSVAAAIVSTHLARFQQQILDVERGILQEDPLYVGAYNIVPLSAIAGAFENWHRILAWLLDIVLYTQVSSGSKGGGSAGGVRSGAQLIDRLRKESKTGYPDIEKIALSLGQFAESAWLRQVSTWLLYGRLPILGAKDFFIQHVAGPDWAADNLNYVNRPALYPAFVTAATAGSILFVGKSLNHIRSQGSKALGAGTGAVGIDPGSLLSEHLSHLSALEHPITPSSFSRAVASIRASLSQNTLQRLLPISDILQVLQVLRQFFLLQRGEFAVAVVNAADDCLAGRQLKRFANDPPQHRDAYRLGGIMIKEGEVSSVMKRAWTVLAALQDTNDDDDDEVLDLARDMLQLSIRRQTTRTAPNQSDRTKLLDPLFDDVLLATPTSLSIDVPSPLDLFLTNAETQAYSLIHAYLLSIRRAHIHLTELWKLSVLRRRHPAPMRPSCPANEAAVRGARVLAARRARVMRATWATIAHALLFLSELGEYLQGEVVLESWSTFQQWVTPDAKTSRPSTRDGTAQQPPPPTKPIGTDSFQPAASPSAAHDPETLTVAHRAYLATLTQALLLSDPHFTKSLRALMTRLDHVVALTKRLAFVVLHTATLELERSHPAAQEEQDLLDNLAEVRTDIRHGLDDLLARLRDIDEERRGGGIRPTTDISEMGLFAGEDTGFIPWRGNGVGRLLMKLEWGSAGFERVF